MLPRNEPVRHIMTTDVLAVQVRAPLSEVRRLLRHHPFHHVPVLDGDRLVGLLSSVDLARLGLEAWGVGEETVDAHLDASFRVEEVMSVGLEALRPHDTVEKATEILADGRFHALPVVDEHEHLVGLLTSTDLLRFFYRAF
jgi:CBS domain-containing protein